MAAISEEKLQYAKKLNNLFDKYHKVVFVNADNVQSQQLHNIRRGLRTKAELLMGKNTMQKKIISLRAENGTAQDKAIHKTFVEDRVLRNNCGLMFTNEDLSVVNAVIEQFKVQAPARVGSISPIDIVIPAGNTGMEPTATSFFQALNIPTKISKGTVEIVSDKKVLSQGDKVDTSVAMLLQKLKINPFYYQLEIVAVWDRGVLFSPEDLQTTDEDLESAVIAGINNVTALSLGAGIPTAVSFPHLLIDAFKDLLAVSIATDFEFTEFNGAKLRKDAKEGKGAAAPAAAPKAAAAAAPAAKPKEKEPEPEEDDDVGLGGLF